MTTDTISIYETPVSGTIHNNNNNNNMNISIRITCLQCMCCIRRGHWRRAKGWLWCIFGKCNKALCVLQLFNDQEMSGICQTYCFLVAFCFSPLASWIRRALKSKVSSKCCLWPADGQHLPSLDRIIIIRALASTQDTRTHGLTPVYVQTCDVGCNLKLPPMYPLL